MPAGVRKLVCQSFLQRWLDLMRKHTAAYTCCPFIFRHELKPSLYFYKHLRYQIFSSLIVK